jgi:hypothetical protein
MAASGVDQVTIAFRRVLAEASASEQARVDALMALWQRTVYAATWPGPNQAARTLTNSHGESALPLFTGLDALDASATRYGWRGPDGTLLFRELPAREAVRHALARNVQFVVMDIGCEHCVELAREELEPLLHLAAQPNGTSPYAGTEQRHQAVLEAVRRSNRPPRMPPPAAPAPAIGSSVPRTLEPARVVPHASLGPQPPPPPLAARLRTPVPMMRGAIGDLAMSMRPAPLHSSAPPEARPLPELPLVPAANSQLFADAPNTANTSRRDDEPTLADRMLVRETRATPAGSAISDVALLALSSGLRGFPEVEWACVLSDGSEIPQIGLSIDPSFLNRVADITDAIMDVGEQQSLALQVLLLNNQELVKNARKNGRAFYPWRRT